MSTSANDREGAGAATRKVSWRSPEIFGELILLGIILILMVVYITELPGLREAGRWLPYITIGIGAPLWIIRLYTVLGRRKQIEQGMIMDLGFRATEDATAERRRAARYALSILILFGGIWTIGFHVGLPLWVATYLALYAKTKWYYLLVVFAAYDAFLFGVLDYVLDIEWFEPLLFRLIGIDYPFNAWPPAGGFA
jgi:hypothetical protein